MTNALNFSSPLIKKWVQQCDYWLRRYLSLTDSIAETDLWTEEQSFALEALYTACLRSSGSVLILLENQRIWDAEILLRSVIEGSIKAVFLMSNKDLFGSRFEEFSTILFDIEGIKQHKKAESVLQSVTNPDGETWKPIRDILFPIEVYEEMLSKYPRSERRRVETKWGFTGLIVQLSKEEFPAADLFVMLLHGYSMASHYLHADYTGVCTALERDCREQDKRNAVYIAHAARIISDIFWMSYLRLYAAYRFIGLDTAKLKELTREYEDTGQELSQKIKEWEDLEYG